MKNINKLLALAAIAAGAAQAQITLYEHDNFNGRRFTATESVASLQHGGFNDQASSLEIRGGRWQICDDSYYRGKCVTLGPGEYRSLRSMDMNDKISSIREIGWGGGGGGGGGGWGGGGDRDGDLVLYDRRGLGGNSKSFNDGKDNLAEVDYNDRAESVWVRRGRWELCTDARFQGYCQEFGPGRYDSLGRLGGQVSSLRQIGGGGGGGGGWGGGGGNRPGDGWGSGRTRVILYERAGFGGRSFELNDNYIPNLDRVGFNDRASSIRVERGYWMFCSDSNFSGDCRTLGPGDYSTLPYGLANKISSARRISEDYPYREPPRYR